MTMFNKKMKLNTKVSLYFGLTAVLLTVLFFTITNFAIRNSFDRYRKENENIQITKIVEHIKDYYENNKTFDKRDFQNLNRLLIKTGYRIAIYDKNDNFIWQIGDMNKFPFTKEKGKLKPRDHFKKEYPIRDDGKIKGYIRVERFKVPPLSEIDKKFKIRLFQGLILAAIIGVSITILIGIFLSKQISKPILKIKNTADILRNGGLSARVNIKTDTKEIEDLNKSINYLAASLENQESLRKRLTSDVSHELRTPLNILQNQLEALIDGIWEATPERLNICYEEVIRLTELIKNLEKLTTLDKMDHELKKENISLNKIIKSVVEQFKPVFMEKNIQVSFTSSEEIKAYVDKNKLKQVLINIMSNANKFTDENGSVNISLSKAEKDAVIKIEDSGVGIDEDDLPHIFERFYRAENSRSRKTGGAGLGLSIVKEIIEAHSGRIYVESEKNKGTTFIIEIRRI